MVCVKGWRRVSDIWIVSSARARARSGRPSYHITCVAQIRANMPTSIPNAATAVRCSPGSWSASARRKCRRAAAVLPRASAVPPSSKCAAILKSAVPALFRERENVAGQLFSSGQGRRARGGRRSGPMSPGAGPVHRPGRGTARAPSRRRARRPPSPTPMSSRAPGPAAGTGRHRAAVAPGPRAAASPCPSRERT